MKCFLYAQGDQRSVFYPNVLLFSKFSLSVGSVPGTGLAAGSCSSEVNFRELWRGEQPSAEDSFRRGNCHGEPCVKNNVGDQVGSYFFRSANLGTCEHRVMRLGLFSTLTIGPKGGSKQVLKVAPDVSEHRIRHYFKEQYSFQYITSDI